MGGFLQAGISPPQCGDATLCASTVPRPEVWGVQCEGSGGWAAGGATGNLQEGKGGALQLAPCNARSLR